MKIKDCFRLKEKIKPFLYIQTRMTSAIKRKLKKSNKPTNIEKYKAAAHKMLQNIRTEFD